MQVRRVGTALAAASALVISGMSAPAFAQSAPSRVGVAKTKPAWLGHAKTLGRASSTGKTNFKVYLAPNGGLAALQARVNAVSKPGSASYRHFISTAQYHKTYDPTPAAVAAVTKFLKDSKLSVASVAANNQYLTVSGTVAHAQAAFGTTINRYSHDGKTVQANSSTLTVPSTIAGAVLAISGIDTTPAIVKPAKSTPAPPPPAYVNGRPCSLYYGQLKATLAADYKTKLPKFQGKTLSYAPCGYTGPQFRAAYEGTTSLDGSGVTVAIVDAYAAPTIAKDANTYAESHGDGSYLPGQLTQNTPASYSHFADCGPSGWFGEETLDVEAVHAMAPAANIRFYAAKSCMDDDLLTAITKVVNENKASLVTNSYGEPDQAESSALIAADEVVFLQGALQGISFLFSSGDNGDELANTAIKQTDSSASDPYVTAVGGTSTAIDESGALAGENGWGTETYALSDDGKSWTAGGYLYGAGGGYSTLFNRPSYQNGVVPAYAPAGRAVPDVAMNADPNTGMLIGETQTFPNGSHHYSEYRIGGTSLSSPLFAGMTALLVQNSGRIGFLNPTIYGQYKAGTFNDVSPKSAVGMGPGVVRVNNVNSVDPTDGLAYIVRTFGQDSSLPTVKGWDPVTGIGSPNSKWLTSIPPAS